jgi:hypothetical protein
MKKIIAILFAALCSVFASYAESISVEDIAIKPGETATADIVLNNTRTDIVAFQMDIVLPEDISINKAECKLSSRITDSDQTLTVGKLESGAIRLTSTSIALIPLSGTNGTLVTIGLSVANDFAMGQVSIENIRLITSNSERIKVNDVSFIVNSLHQLTYVVDGEVYKTLAVAYGTPIIPEAEPTKEGYTFSGWSEIPETMPAHDVEVTGTFSINSYTLTYLLDGEVYKTETVVYGTPLTPEPTLQKEGYTFSGWSEIPATMPAHDVTVTGTFTVNSYKLTYIVDGEIYKTETVDYGTPLTPEPALQKEGYTFSGWSEIPETMPAHDVEVTGSFTVNFYTITYMLDGEEYETSTIAYGTPITPEAEPTKEGYTFSGWSEIPTTMPAHDITVTGSFTINSYKLTYLIDGEVYKTETINYGTTIVPEPALAKEGYTFSGWSEIPETMPAHDVTVTGSFTVNYYTLTYMVDGEVYKTLTIAYGTTITPEARPVKVGYTFSGWSEIPATMPAKDVVVTGSFSINSYTLTYIVDGEVYKKESVEYGTPLIPEPAPKKEGYTFSGWSAIPETMPARDVEVTGSFSINSYKLTYVIDGVEYKTVTIEYGAVIIPEEPTKEGYTFSGWSAIPETMPAFDLVVKGSFIINQYLLTYVLDGEEYKSFEIDYNAIIVPISASVKKGMTFSGWTDIPERMPAHDVTVTGTYSWAKETVDYVVYQVTDTLNNYASVIGYEKNNGEARILSDLEIDGYWYTVNDIADGALPQTVTIYVPVGRLLLILWNAGYDNILEAESGRELAAPEISLVAATASSLDLSYVNEYREFRESVVISSTPIEKGENGYEMVLRGLEPGKLYDDIGILTLTLEDVSYTKTSSFKTEALVLATQQPKVVSLGNVIVAAESNLDNEEQSVGFEWRRIDWTDDFASGTGAAYLYEGMMEGYIHNLNTEKLWKYRPYYESNSGTRYYGEWVGIDPSNASYFEPTVHTYSTITVTGNSVEVKGYAMQGTDNVTSQGFAYWTTSPISSRRKVNGIPDDATIVLVNGNVMTATLDNLEYDTEYCCVAFMTTSEGETFYGEQQFFKTNIDPDDIGGVKAEEEVTEVARYDLNGRRLSAPQKGINIIRYSDGTTRKVLLK